MLMMEIGSLPCLKVDKQECTRISAIIQAMRRPTSLLRHVHWVPNLWGFNVQVNAAPGGYVRPKMGASGPLAIVEGRHPLMEQLQGADAFVPNDTYLAGTCQAASNPFAVPFDLLRVASIMQASSGVQSLDVAITSSTAFGLTHSRGIRSISQQCRHQLGSLRRRENSHLFHIISRD